MHKLFGEHMKETLTVSGKESDLIQCFSTMKMRTGDILMIPMGYEAILVVEGAFSELYREGDTLHIQRKLKKKHGQLYVLRMAPTERMEWGIGNVKSGAMEYGLHGSVRLRNASSRKLLDSFIGMQMPLTDEQVFDDMFNALLDAIRAVSGHLDGLETHEKWLANEAIHVLDETLESKGLMIDNLSIEPVYRLAGVL